MSDAITSAIESSVAAAKEEGIFGGGAEEATVEVPSTEVETPAAEPAAPVAETPAAPAATPVVETAEQKAEAAKATEKNELDKIRGELLEKTPGLANGKIRVVDHQAVLTRSTKPSSPSSTRRSSSSRS